MTYRPEYNIPDHLLEEIAEQGLDVVPELIRTVINAAMRIERQRYLGVEPYERSPERRGRANGYKSKTVGTRMGRISFEVPQVREGGFYPQALEKGLRSERALKLALAEMYIQGVSTRKVAAITQQLCGFEVSSSQVSQATAALDEQLQAWRERPLGQIKYLYLDAHYEKVRRDGQVRDAAVLKAAGVNMEGKREVLGVAVSLSEAELHWRSFVQTLVARGLSGVELITSDAHPGLAHARRAVFGGVPWQRCQFHLQQNAQAHVPKQGMKADVAADIRAIFNAPNRQEAERLLAMTIQKYEQKASGLSQWLEANIPEGLTVFAFPASHRRLLRTTNGLERLTREIRRRSRTIGIFPSEASSLRLVTAVVMEISDEWLTNRIYLSPDAT
jgi:putative transposase